MEFQDVVRRRRMVRNYADRAGRPGRRRPGAGQRHPRAERRVQPGLGVPGARHARTTYAGSGRATADDVDHPDSWLAGMMQRAGGDRAVLAARRPTSTATPSRTRAGPTATRPAGRCRSGTSTPAMARAADPADRRRRGPGRLLLRRPAGRATRPCARRSASPTTSTRSASITLGHRADDHRRRRARRRDERARRGRTWCTAGGGDTRQSIGLVPRGQRPRRPAVSDPRRRKIQHGRATSSRQSRAAERAAAAKRIEQQQTWVDLQIQQAMARGDFDDLPGAGKPIEDLGTEHDPDWWLKRLIEREQITGVLPPALAAAQGGRRARRRARPAHRRVGGTPRGRGVQRPGAAARYTPGGRAAADHPAARRRRDGGGLAGARTARTRRAGPHAPGADADAWRRHATESPVNAASPVSRRSSVPPLLDPSYRRGRRPLLRSAA